MLPLPLTRTHFVKLNQPTVIAKGAHPPPVIAEERSRSW